MTVERTSQLSWPGSLSKVNHHSLTLPTWTDLTPIRMLGRRANRTRWTHLACPMSLTAGAQGLLISKCPTASLSPNSFRWVTRFRHLLKLWYLVSTYNSSETNCCSLALVPLVQFLNWSSGIPPHKLLSKKLHHGLTSCPSPMSSSLTVLPLFSSPLEMGQQQLSLLSTPPLDLVSEGHTAFRLMHLPLPHVLKLWQCWELFYGPLS